MSVNVALTAGEITALAGATVPRWYAVHDTTGGANTVATARVNGAPSYPLSTLTVDGTSAGWSSVAAGMAVFIGSTAGGFDRGIYIVRKAGTATTLEIGAIGENDAGIHTIQDRSTTISDDDYITVLYRSDIFGKFPRIDYPGEGLDATIYENYDSAYSNFNRYPPPIVNITINGRPSNYATHAYSGTSATFDIVASITLWATSASVTWAWTLPSGVTLNSGASSGSGTSSTINVTVAHAADPYVIKFVATENNGNAMTSFRKVWVKSDTYPPLNIVRIDNHEDDTTGSSWSITLNTLTACNPDAMWHIFDMGNWNGSDVASAIHEFTGYVIRRRGSSDIGVANVTLDLVGPSYMLERIGGQSQIFTSVESPANWQEVYTTLSYLDFIIWWLLMQRVSGLLQMFNCTLFGFTTTQKRMTDWRIDTGTLLDQVQSLARRVPGGNFGCDPGGEIMLRRWPSRVPSGDRSTIATRFTLTNSQYTHADRGEEVRPRVRRLRGEAFYSDGSTNTPVWCDAPELPGQGASEEKFDRLIVDNAAEIYAATGDEYAARNNPYPDGSILINKNWAVVRPAQLLRGYLTIPAAVAYDGVQWAGYITVRRVSYTHNPDGTIDTNPSWEAETTGSDAVDVPIPEPDPSKYQSRYQAKPYARIPAQRAIRTRNGVTNPAGTTAGASSVPRDGSVGLCGTATNVYLYTNFLGTPIYRDVTPSLGGYSIKHGMIQIRGKKAWILGSDGTNSRVWYTANVFASTVSWATGTAYTGVYTLVRPAQTAGVIEIYGGSVSGTWTHTFDFTAGDQGFAQVPEDGTGYNGSYVAATGWQGTAPAIAIALSNSGVFRTGSVTVSGPADAGGNITVQTDTAYVDTAAWNAGKYGEISSGSSFTTLSGTFTNSPVSVPAADYLSVAIGGSGTTKTITSLTVTGDGDDPFGASTSTTVRHSTDNGSTFGAEIAVGSSFGSIAGFDVQRNGTVSIASMALKTRKATTLGGAYSDDETFDTNPKLVEIPWGTRNSTTLNSGSSPEYIVGLDAADTSGNTLYWVVGGTPVDITPMVGGNPGIPVSADCLCTWLGKYIAFIGSFGGTKKLVTSIDGGSNWIDRGAVDATYLRLRRLANTPGQLFAAGTALKYSGSFGASLATKTKPSASALIFLEPYG